MGGQARLHFSTYCYSARRIVVIPLLNHPTPSSMEGINAGPPSNWISASWLGAAQWLPL